MSRDIRRTRTQDYEIDSYTGEITVTQRWRYRWRVLQSTLAARNEVIRQERNMAGLLDYPREDSLEWFYQEKQDFKRKAVAQVGQVWSYRVHVEASRGIGSENRTRFVLKFVIEEVPVRPHWNIFVYKVAPGNRRRAYIVPWARRIFLYSRDTRIINNRAGPGSRYSIIAHEFGHALGGQYRHRANRDEYVGRMSSNFNDRRSVMHSGQQLRERHFRQVLWDLNRMIPGVRFTISQIVQAPANLG